jgi:hypothetical protein
VPQDLTALAEPQFVLISWGAGLAVASGLVAMARIVGPGFTWLAGSVAALLGLAGAFGESPWWGRLGLLLLVLGLVWARNSRVAGLLQLGAGVALIIQASSLGAILPAVSAALALGGVTGEMLLGHWYLIDPSLPRWSLRALAIAGIGGIAFDATLLAVAGFPSGGATIAYWVLTITSVVLMSAVLASLRYPAYSGVMSATGLSYLAVLTTAGSVFLGRVLIAGLGFFTG